MMLVSLLTKNVWVSYPTYDVKFDNTYLEKKTQL